MKRTFLNNFLWLIFVSSLGLALQAQPAPAKNTPVLDRDAMDALNRMGDYLRSLKDFQVKAEITTEDVLTDGQKLQFGHTSTVIAHMPDQLRWETEGERMSRMFLYDGKLFTLYARRLGYYATVPAPPTILQLMETLSDKYDIEIPLGDLFIWGGPHAKTNEVTDAINLGPGEIGGVTCDHYAFRQPGVDWQVWIQSGDHPLPRKLVLTTMSDDARPQHVTVLTWNLAPSYNEQSFVFDPPADAHKIVFAEASRGN